MKKYQILLLAILCVLPNISNADTWANIQKNKTIVVATEGAYEPFNYFDHGKVAGFEIDLVNKIAKKLGLTVEWKTASFDSLLIGLSQGRYDLVAASHGITPEREKAVTFTNPEYCTGGTIVTVAGGPMTKADLKGKKIAVQLGTTELQNLKRIPGVSEPTTFAKDTDAMLALQNGKVDAWITDKFAGLDASKKNQSVKLIIGDTLFNERVGMAVEKGNKQLADQVNKVLATLMKNGEYAKLSKKYFGQDIRCPK